MLSIIKNKAKKLLKNKKGVSQFVEMLIIIGVTVAVGVGVVGIVWSQVNSQKDKIEDAPDVTDPNANH